MVQYLHFRILKFPLIIVAPKKDRTAQPYKHSSELRDYILLAVAIIKFHHSL
jgi:hypothetical protein